MHVLAVVGGQLSGSHFGGFTSVQQPTDTLSGSRAGQRILEKKSSFASAGNRTPDHPPHVITVLTVMLHMCVCAHVCMCVCMSHVLHYRSTDIQREVW